MGLKWKIWKKNISFLKRLVRPASPDFWLALSYVIISLLLFIVNMFATKLLLSSHVCLNPSYRCRWEWVGKARINVKDFSFDDFGDYSNHSKNWKVTKSVVDPPVWEARFRQLFFDVILTFRSVHFLSFAVFCYWSCSSTSTPPSVNCKIISNPDPRVLSYPSLGTKLRDGSERTWERGWIIRGHVTGFTTGFRFLSVEQWIKTPRFIFLDYYWWDYSLSRGL